MPVMDGIQFLQKVRSLYGRIPFLLFTGKGREEVVITALNSGVDFYIPERTYPSQLPNLAHAIRQAVERKTGRGSSRLRVHGGLERRFRP